MTVTADDFLNRLDTMRPGDWTRIRGPIWTIANAIAMDGTVRLFPCYGPVEWGAVELATLNTTGIIDDTTLLEALARLNIASLADAAARLVGFTDAPYLYHEAARLCQLAETTESAQARLRAEAIVELARDPAASAAVFRIVNEAAWLVIDAAATAAAAGLTLGLPASANRLLLAPFVDVLP